MPDTGFWNGGSTPSQIGLIILQSVSSIQHPASSIEHLLKPVPHLCRAVPGSCDARFWPETNLSARISNGSSNDLDSPSALISREPYSAQESAPERPGLLEEGPHQGRNQNAGQQSKDQEKAQPANRYRKESCQVGVGLPAGESVFSNGDCGKSRGQRKRGHLEDSFTKSCKRFLAKAVSPPETENHAIERDGKSTG